MSLRRRQVKTIDNFFISNSCHIIINPTTYENAEPAW